MKNLAKKISVFLSVVMVCGMLSACSHGEVSSSSTQESGSADSSSDKSDTSESSDEVVKVAWIGVSGSDESTIVSLEFAEKYAQELGNIEVISFDANADPQTQVNCVNSAVTQGCEIILCCPLDVSALASCFQDALNHGSQVFTVGGDVLDENARTAYVGPDETESGRIAARKIMEALPDGGNVVLVEGNAGETVQINRTAGFKEAIEGSNINIIDSHTTEAWQPEMAMSVMEDFLTKYDDIDAVFCEWDNGTVAVVEAIKAAGRDEDGIVIVSIDGCYNGFDLVSEGEILGTVMNPYEVMMRDSIDLGLRGLAGEELDSYYYTECVFITADNVDDYDPGW